MRSSIKNLKKAAIRILKAVNKKEPIILYGDADLDGAASVVLLKESINSLGGRVKAIYFPDREFEGYGLTETSFSYLADKAPALLITVDCGIGNFTEMKKAKKLGFEVIIIDHHEVLGKLPEAKIIVDPKQKGDKYPFKGLAAVGVVFKLVQLLFKGKIAKSLEENFLELVALATIADMMPRESDNLLFIEKGLAPLERSLRPGLKVFFGLEVFDEDSNLQEKVSKIVSLLNVRDVKERLPASFRLLTAPSLPEAKKIVKTLLRKQEVRKKKIGETVEEVEDRLVELDKPIIFEGAENFDLTLLSTVASIISRRYKKATFLYKKMKTETQGTVRSPSTVDVIKLMKKCSKYPLTYGGHAQAAGFRIKNENLEKFKKCLIKNAQ